MPPAILLQDVEQLGERGEVVDVSAGYLRNYLLPRNLAQPATRAGIEGGAPGAGGGGEGRARPPSARRRTLRC